MPGRCNPDRLHPILRSRTDAVRNTVSDILLLSLDQLKRPLKIHSRTLAADLWLLPPGRGGHGLDGPAYTCEECRLLDALDLSAADLKALHLAKTLLQGDLLPNEDPRSLRRLHEILLEKYREVERRFNDPATCTEASELLQASTRLSLVLDLLDKVGRSRRDATERGRERGDGNPG